ncbi:MAG: DNA-directed RNA polymerase subunit omega [Actinobacteria bacterium]|nr:MAG: DNA-directed RNA polymerase subunit omega [Actinomycetota bacterium]
MEDLMNKLDSKFGLVIVSAKRARQINDYLNSIKKHELPQCVSPQVPLEEAVKAKPLSVALLEIAEGNIAYEKQD